MWRCLDLPCTNFYGSCMVSDVDDLWTCQSDQIAFSQKGGLTLELANPEYL
jgi:hypothetical protein